MEDARFAARIRSLLVPYTEPAIRRYTVGQQVMEALLQQLPASDRARFSWDLRIAKDAGNVFSSPDGTIFVDSEMARVMGSRSGLWAAALSHEISHIVRRDWARRYLFQKSLEAARTSQVVIGDAGTFSGEWKDAQSASGQLANFCQMMELDADAEGLMLMTRAGFDPDFVPALHHLLESLPGQRDENILDPSHPRWDEREQKLKKLFAAAGSEYDRLWPQRFASPGGNSPTVVYVNSPTAKRGAYGKLEVQIPMHCENLFGALEVVVRFMEAPTGFPSELRQLTGCTSNRTLVTFDLPSAEVGRERRVQAEISVLDASGATLNSYRSSIAIH